MNTTVLQVQTTTATATTALPIKHGIHQAAAIEEEEIQWQLHQVMDGSNSVDVINTMNLSKQTLQR